MVSASELKAIKADLATAQGLYDRAAARLQVLIDREELAIPPRPVYVCGHSHKNREEAIACDGFQQWKSDNLKPSPLHVVATE